MSKERRKHTRIPLCFKAEITFTDGEKIAGTTQNISFGGAFIACKKLANTERRDNCTFTIIRPSDKDPLLIPIKCKIVRSDATGIGLRFISMDINDYQKFKKLMVYNSTEPNVLIEELEADPGLAIV